MRYRDEATDLRVEIRTASCELSDTERARIETDLHGLRRVVADFPGAELHLDIHCHPDQRDYHVRSTLHVAKHDFFTGERGPSATQAVEHCARKLVAKIKRYKETRRERPRRVAAERARLRLLEMISPLAE